MEYCMCTSFGACEEHYRRNECKLVGTGQGNAVSVNICRGVLGLNSKTFESEESEIQTIGLSSKEQEQQIVVVFVDDTDLIIDRDDSTIKTQRTLSKHAILYKESSGHAQCDKTNHFMKIDEK